MGGSDYLDELVAAEIARDPSYAAEWARVEERIQMALRRKAAGLTQAQVAERMEVPQPRVAEIERHPDRVSVRRLRSYADALGYELALVPKSR